MIVLGLALFIFLVLLVGTISSVNYESKLTVTETQTVSGAPYAQNQNVTYVHDQLNQSQTGSPTTTPPLTHFVSYEKALSAGAATIDLTTNTGTNGAVVDFTTKKLSHVKLRNKAGNAGAITIAEGVSNGHPFLGAAFKIILPVGCEILISMIAPGGTTINGTAVAATDRTWDITGTGTDVLQVEIAGG